MADCHPHSMCWYLDILEGLMRIAGDIGWMADCTPHSTLGSRICNGLPRPISRPPRCLLTPFPQTCCSACSYQSLLTSRSLASSAHTCSNRLAYPTIVVCSPLSHSPHNMWLTHPSALAALVNMSGERVSKQGGGRDGTRQPSDLEVART